MLGSTAVDLGRRGLVWVADGTLDVSITLGNRAWDMAAGMVIARQAHAALLDADGTPVSTLTEPTSTQRRAFELLGTPVPFTLKQSEPTNAQDANPQLSRELGHPRSQNFG